MIAFSAWKDREICRQSVRLYSLAGDDDDRDLLTAFKIDIEGVQDSLSAMMKMNAVPDFDQRLVEALGIFGMSVPTNHLNMNALRRLFRDTWIGVIKIVQALVEAVGGAAPTPDDPAEQVRPMNCQHKAVTSTASDGPKVSELIEGYLRCCNPEEDYARKQRMYA